MHPIRYDIITHSFAAQTSLTNTESISMRISLAKTVSSLFFFSFFETYSAIEKKMTMSGFSPAVSLNLVTFWYSRILKVFFFSFVYIYPRQQVIERLFAIDSALKCTRVCEIRLEWHRKEEQWNVIKNVHVRMMNFSSSKRTYHSVESMFFLVVIGVERGD